MTGSPIGCSMRRPGSRQVAAAARAVTRTAALALLPCAFRRGGEGGEGVFTSNAASAATLRRRQTGWIRGILD